MHRELSNFIPESFLSVSYLWSYASLIEVVFHKIDIISTICLHNYYFFFDVDILWGYTTVIFVMYVVMEIF